MNNVDAYGREMLDDERARGLLGDETTFTHISYTIKAEKECLTCNYLQRQVQLIEPVHHHLAVNV